ncbi:MAG: YhbY family RNA-binding protein [Burkholderiaceae bacterium]
MTDTPTPLTTQQIKTLKAQAHHLNPVVMLGAAGLADAVVQEIEGALTAHGLIKIKLGGENRVERAALMAEICARTGAQPIQSIGKVGVVWREKPEKSAENTEFVTKQKAGERAVKRSPTASKPRARRAKSTRK